MLWLLSLQRSQDRVQRSRGSGAGNRGPSDSQIKEKRRETDVRIYVRVKVLRETLRNPFLSTTWEHPLDIHVGPAAATLPLSAAPPLCRSFLVQSDVFITAYTPPASQQMLCLYMAVSAQPRRRIPFKRLGGCHSDSRSSSCPTLVAQSVARLSVRFIYSTLWSV